MDDVKPGFEVEYTREVTDEDIERFALATGDENPLHLDENYARNTRFRGRIAHGLLTAGLVSAALARLPGTVVYVSQSLTFAAPVRPGDVLTARARVEDREKRKVRLRTTVEGEDGEPVLTGEAEVLLLD